MYNGCGRLFDIGGGKVCVGAERMVAVVATSPSYRSVFSLKVKGFGA